MPEVNEIRELESEAVEAASVPTGADPTDADPTGAGQGNGSAKDADSLKEQILEALKNVLDPELGVNIVDLGLVYGVEIEGDAVHVTYTLTTMGCPIGPLIEAEIRQFLSTVEGVEQVEAEMVLRPPWTPEMMSEEAKAALGYF
jgi:metal-sulfur cluster biosynthetic enzyme